MLLDGYSMDGVIADDLDHIYGGYVMGCENKLLGGGAGVNLNHWSWDHYIC